MIDSDPRTVDTLIGQRAEEGAVSILPQDLTAIAKRVRHHQAAGDKAAGSALVNYFEAGRLIVSVKNALPNKAFLTWLKTECGAGTRNVGIRTWQRYMALAQIICERTGLPITPDDDPHATRASHVDLFVQNDFTSVRQVLALRGAEAGKSPRPRLAGPSKEEAERCITSIDEHHEMTVLAEQRPMVIAPLLLEVACQDLWTTPPQIVGIAERVLGRIDLDPCGTATANPRIRAKTVYTPEKNGLDISNPWKGNAFIFPPRTAIANWIDRLIAEFQGGALKQSLALLPACTDTEWFKRVAAFPCAFLFERIAFDTASGGPQTPADLPYVVVYLGEEVNRFAAGFRTIAQIYTPYVVSP